MQLIDSHAHYDDSRFAEEYEGGADKALCDAHELGITAVINCGTRIETSLSSIALADKFEFVYAAVGYHPEDCQSVADEDEERVLDEINALAKHDKVVAIGEIGLDYHYDGTMKEKQHRFFEYQLSMAKRLDLPVIIHDRDAHGDTMEIVRRHKGVRGVFHSFSGSAEMARQLVDIGWYISFSGPITYKNTGKLQEAARIVPTDRILVETDCPYLPPVPYRGKLNYSGYMFNTLNALAAARNEDADALAEATVKNAKELFAIK